MTERYDAVTSRKDKDGKWRSTRIGAAFPSKKGDGFSIVLDALPMPNAEGQAWITLFPAKPKDDAPSSKPSSSGRRSPDQDASVGDMNDEIPF